jgi:adenylate cyclase
VSSANATPDEIFQQKCPFAQSSQGSRDFGFMLVSRWLEAAMAETRKLAAILVSDVVGYSRLAGSDEDRILARLRALRSDLIDPIIAVHNGRIVKRTGDGSIVEFRSVVDAVRCAIEVQNGMVERNAGLPPERRIEFRIGIHLGDVVEESDGDLMGDGVNIAARLEGVAKPGAICLSEDAYRQVKSRLDIAVSDLGATQLKNIAEPMRVYSLQVGAPTQAKPTKLSSKPRSTLVPLLAAIVGLIGIAGGGWYFFNAKRTTSNAPIAGSAAHLSIVVLPFANLSGDASQDYFADGVSENLTTDLSRIRNSFVIARNTAFSFKGKNVDTKAISKELGVRYVLEGSVQRDQNQVRVNAQLIDGETGAHLWADRFEEDVTNLFKLQDQVVARLANTLRHELVRAEAEKDTGSKNADAIDLAMRGRALLWPPFTKDKVDTARTWFEKALKVDPNNSDALAGEAYTYTLEFAFGSRNSETDYDAKILGQADRSVTLDRNNALAYLAKSFYLLVSLRPNDAFRAANAGLAIDPNNASLLATRSIAQTYLRQFEQAKSDVQQAMRLSPRDPALSQWHNFLADAEIGLGNLNAAIEEANKAIDGGYRVFYAYLNLAVAHALKGDMDEARAPLAEARRLNPKLSVKWLTERKPVLQPAFDSLRKAGLPEE